ncbi:transcriptional regulator Mic [Klebsiella pneumoniae]|uniref:Transcriptional regulator Mic n=1 Tax=Klebsiella pneumoniae TaxID=573 RepID=A0A377TRX5_KLEPN|nr:transcriptional regulator Mic [Klebsiella pneumoniae]
MSRSAKRWPIIPGCQSIFSMTSAPGLWRNLCLAPRAAPGTSIQVVIDHNVGAGVITDGRLLHAGSSSLVEIGHTQVDPYGKRCYCGNHGCLETIASVESVLELAQMRMAQSMSSLLHQRPLSVEWLCQAALQGDLLARDIISGVGNHVGANSGDHGQSV